MIASCWCRRAPGILAILCCWSGAIGAEQAALVQKHDRYGGLPVRVAARSRFFHPVKAGDRWVLATPEGNVFWLRGVYNVSPSGSIDEGGASYAQVAKSKYGDSDITWGPRQVRRLESWGFNATAEYSSGWVQATATHPSWPQGRQPAPMPFTVLVWPSYYALRNSSNFAPGPVKELVQPTNPKYFDGYRAHSPDIWDPNFRLWLEGALQHDPSVVQWLSGPNADYLIGVNVDDADWMQGFGAGADFPTVAGGKASGGREQPHLGWIVLITPATQISNPEIGVRYSDNVVYSKRELAAFLKTRYRTIDTLNQAWASNYTTFDSTGGWGVGTGLLDEDGKHRWVPRDYLRLKDGTEALRRDLDDFLFVHARKYFSDVKGALNRYAPGRLYLGPTTLGGWGDPPRRQILAAAASVVDVLCLPTIPAGVPDDQRRIDFVAANAGDMPWISWEGEMANPDSRLHAYPTPDGVIAGSRTQAARGTLFADRLERLFEVRTSSGVHPMAGYKFWEFADNWGEKANWGLVSMIDDAYDGVETKDHGDFLSAVRRANQALDVKLEHAVPAAETTAVRDPRRKASR